ncbi:hypothetical protein Y032_0233g3084 [Ancylostoma ceylanicum]|uniref:Uncharacterized protein n=1 Tax=Ancylostoma ceylanicum TaxID=53326 RepID=A0A016SFX3_9BILA|nr:hypothetical protein Y032_0233g3084 [Ancylostoma ceylanicum]
MEKANFIMRYSIVETDFGDDETKNFGKRNEFASLTSLYEIKTLATVSGDFDNTENEEPGLDITPPTVISESNEKWLAIAVGDDVSIFSSNFDLEHLFTQPFKNGTNIRGIGWLADSHILAVVSASMEVTFLSAKLNTVIVTMDLPTSTPCTEAVLSSDVVNDTCYLSVVRENGEAFALRINNWAQLINATKETLTECCESLSTAEITTTSSKYLPRSVVNKGDSFLLIPQGKQPLQISSVAKPKFYPLGDSDTAESYVRARRCSNGRFLMGLTMEGLFVVTDLWTFATVLEKSIRTNPSELFLDFMFVDKPGIGPKLGTIAVVVQCGDHMEMQVRSMKTLEVAYRVTVTSGTTLLPVSETADRVILLVEPFASKTLSDEDAVKLREIVESQPEMKLQRLIARNQLDQAEQFATQFGLDVQKVHVARMEYLFSQSTINDSDEDFKKLMKSFEAVKDHNMVGEICFSGAITFDKYDRIIGLLAYAKKRAITDSETIDRLAQASYILASYRLIMGPENARFDVGSMWQDFVAGVQGEGEWCELFFSMLGDGLVKEAQILWNRHITYIAPHFNNVENEEATEATMKRFFETLRNAVLENLSIWRDTIAFLEYDFVPICLSKMSKEICPLLVDYLLSLARDLETLDSENFPLNALHATSTFERILLKQVDETITATRQAELGYVGCQLRSDAHGKVSRLTELDTYTANLKEIHRLKTVYECPLSYSTFVGLTSEQICHQILQQSVQNPNFMKNVERYARQYMAEHNLEPDETLYRYVEAESSRSRNLVGRSSAWHDQCLLVSETIENLSIRCKAVCMIAKGAHLPWSRRLSEAVQFVLKNPQVDMDIKKSLEAICRTAEMGQILMSYSTPLGMLDTVLGKEYSFIKFIRFMFTHDRYSLAQRLVDAVKMVETYCQLFEKHSPLVSLVRVYVLYAEYLQKCGTQELTVLQFLEELRAEKGEKFLFDVASRLIGDWQREIDSGIVVWTEASVARRMGLITATKSVILRFMPNNDRYMGMYENLCSIQKLQETYNMYVTTPQLENKDWRDGALKNFIVREERSLLEVIAFSGVLRMSRDEASRLSIKLAVDSGNPIGALTIVRDALRCVSDASPALAEVCVHGCEFVLWRLQETLGNGSESPAEPEVVEQSVDSVVILSRVLRILEPVTSHSLNLQESVTRMYGYANIFMQLVNQCMLDDAESDSSSQKEQSKSDDVASAENRIYGVRRRVGVYQMRSEGPLFSRMEAIASISAVAQSVVRADKLDEETRDRMYAEQATKWCDLFNFLSLSNQDLLEYQARVYAATLPCFTSGHMEELGRDGGLKGPIRNVCLRALQAHPCDLWTPCTLLSSLSPQTIEEVVLELRNVLSNRKSPQTMLNFLRTVQFASILTQNNAPEKMLTDTFIKTLWAKRLGKAGLSPTLPRKAIDAAICDFAKHKLDPNIVVEYVDEFCGVHQLQAQLLNYAIELVQLASAAKEQQEITAFLEVAHQALKVNEIPIAADKSLEAFRNILYTICPYNYQVLSFIICHLKSVSSNQEEEVFVAGCSAVLDFLMETKRQNTISKAELVWYTNREKQLVNDKKDPTIENFGEYCRCYFEKGTRPASRDTTTTSFTEEDQERNLYERDMLVIAMPPEAKRRLPFHPFLYLAAGDIEKFLVPVVEKELDIYNVVCWQAVLRSVSWLKTSSYFSRSRLLSVAVGRISAEVIAKGQDLSPVEEKTIQTLLMQTPSRNAVVNCVAVCFKKLPLCETKIRLMEMGRDVAQHWLAVPDIEPAMDLAERMAIEEQVSRLSTAIEKYNTELILKKSGLYNEKTCDLIESPAELIGHIYTNCIEWKSAKDREQKMAVVELLAKANHLRNLPQIQEELVMSWLIADKVDDAYAVDPNDTMGNAGLDIGMSSSDENELFLLPFFDVTVDRIVYVLKLINMDKIMGDLITYLRRDASTVAGGFRTIVRAACVLLRAYTNTQLKKVNYDHVKICVDLEAVLYGRLLDLAHVDIPLDTFRRQEKSVVVRGLVAPGTRWTPQLAFLVASLIVDNEIADRSVVEMVLNRLQSSQKREMFVTLLTFCRQEKKLHRTKNLAMMWARAVDWSLGSIENVTGEMLDEFEHWFYFAVSCPVEGGRSFDSIRNALRARNYVVAAYLIAIVASFTQRCQPLDYTTVNPHQELMFNWTKAGLKDVPMEV